MMSNRARCCLAGAALMAVLLTACDGSDHVKVPGGLLSAKTVGGTAVGDARKHLDGNAGLPEGTPDEQCSLDGASLTLGASDDNAMAYRRTVDGHRETVVIGANDTTLDIFTLAREQLKTSLAGPGCDRPPVIQASAVDLGLDGTVAFSSERTIAKRKEGILRSYTFVHENGQKKLVLVSIERTDGTVPSTSELKKLTAAQVHKTTTKLTD
jgi:hypothetical protein